MHMCIGGAAFVDPDGMDLVLQMFHVSVRAEAMVDVPDQLVHFAWRRHEGSHYWFKCTTCKKNHS